MKSLTEQEMLTKALTSPALTWLSDRKGSFAYPKKWNKQVPLKVSLNKTVTPDINFSGKEEMIALKDQEYYAWVNSYGAVSAILPNGECLGLYPNEFVVTAFHQKKPKE